MAAITNPKNKATQFSATQKVWFFNALAITSAQDTLTLTEDDNGIESIDTVVATISGGLDAAFSYVQVSHSGLVITIDSFEQDGTAATDFTSTTVNLIVIGQ